MFGSFEAMYFHRIHGSWLPPRPAVAVIANQPPTWNFRFGHSVVALVGRVIQGYQERVAATAVDRWRAIQGQVSVR
ncbi:MAG TPA: hypothetical protein VIY86_01195 [Pirellulaceae bacterium]